jgi:hypothetical protein
LSPVVDEPTPSEQVFLAISKSVAAGRSSARTIQLMGSIQDVPVQLLVNSGSSSSFINVTLVDRLQLFTSLPLPSSVQVAGGGLLHSLGIIQHVCWKVDQCTFTINFHVLQLSSFDAILGMDWLESHSPMQVHWLQKWLAIPYHGSVQILQGLLPDAPDQLVLQLEPVPSDDPPISTSVPESVQGLLTDFTDLFSPPTSLPPSRACNHTIPLIPGAQPVFIRPYRYPPRLKDEIERQVQDMLT